jgi:cytochrome b subunit of formate dehydrogenase
LTSLPTGGREDGRKEPKVPDKQPLERVPAGLPSGSAPGSRAPGQALETTGGQPEFRLLTTNQLVQHWLLILTFITLMATGIPLRYHEVPGMSLIVRLCGGMKWRGVIHRGAGAIFIALAFYHLAYVIFSRRGAEECRALMFDRKDLNDLAQQARFFVGLELSPPLLGRHNFANKADYLAVALGGFVMSATGLLLWHHDLAMLFLPKWAMDVVRAIHSWEALLALLAVITWHLYNAHLKPGHFPMNWVWLTGKMTRAQMLRRYPLELEEMEREKAAGTDGREEAAGVGDG